MNFNFNGVRALIVPVDPAAYSKEAEMPHYPGAMLAYHVALRTAQVGGLIGLLYSPAAYFRGERAAGTSFIRQTLPRLCLKGTIWGSIVGLAGVTGRCVFLDSEGVIDRGYRLYHNKQQNVSDVFTLTGALVGGFVGLPSLLGGAVSKAARGSACGMAIGLGAYAAGRYLVFPELPLWAQK